MLVVIASSTAAVAQPEVAPGTPRIRTGPNAEPAPLPPFSQPPPPAIGLAPVDPGPGQPVASLGDHRITRVRIAADGDGRTALPPDAWLPPRDATGSVQLRHNPGQPLDLAWVQAQFDQQTGADGIRPSTAVALVQSINRAFITAGFVNSGLLVSPQSDTAAGLLDLRLIYGRLGLADGQTPPIAVTWTQRGRAGLSDAYIRRRFPSTANRPLNAFELERDFRLLTEDPMIRSVGAALRPGEGAGEASLSLEVQPAERLDLYIGAANDRSPSVGGEHVFIGSFVRSALVSGDTLTVDAGMTKGVKDAQASYVTPLFDPALFLSLRAGFNNAAVTDRPLLPLDISARDRHAEIGVARQLVRTPLMGTATPGRWSASQTLTAGASLIYRKQRSYLLGEPFSFAPGSVDGRTEYHAARLTADYVRRNVDHVLAASLAGTVGLGGTQSDIASIPNPSDHFLAALGQLNYARRLGGGLEFRGRLTGQFSGGTLYSGERLSIGGVSSVRGYRESLLLVDRGIIANAELAYQFSVSGRKAPGAVDWGAFTASVFADNALFRNAAEPQPGRRFISSVGGSLGWTPSPAFTALATYGHALHDVTTPMQDDLQDRGLHFRVLLHPLRL